MKQLCRLALLIAALLLPSAYVVAASGRVPTLMIAAIGVTSPIIEFPLTRTSWAIEPWETSVGHLEGTARLSESGNTVLAGHSRMPDGKAGIFARLETLKAGSEIVVFDGVSERVYLVTRVFTVGAEDVSVVYPSSDDRLTLITCDANSFNAASQRYDQRIVVVAERSGQ